jgi:hypothetical protein
MLLVTISWAANFAVIKDALDVLGNGPADGTLFVAARFLLAAMVLAPFLLTASSKEAVKAGLGVGALCAFGYGAQALALSMGSQAGACAFICSLQSVVVPLIKARTVSLSRGPGFSFPHPTTYHPTRKRNTSHRIAGSQDRAGTKPEAGSMEGDGKAHAAFFLSHIPVGRLRLSLPLRLYVLAPVGYHVTDQGGNGEAVLWACSLAHAQSINSRPVHQPCLASSSPDLPPFASDPLGTSASAVLPELCPLPFDCPRRVLWSPRRWRSSAWSG